MFLVGFRSGTVQQVSWSSTAIFSSNGLKFYCPENMAYYKFSYLVFQVLETQKYTRNVGVHLKNDKIETR
jgi:hypothetical protein